MSSTSFSSKLGRDQFLQLFTKQLRYQDPLEPVKQEDYLAQLAQFSQVEGLENINQKFDTML
ncbi:MAG: flagellar hook assembly protein FlgD, partial [Planctomyces sp.]